MLSECSDIEWYLTRRPCLEPDSEQVKPRCIPHRQHGDERFDFDHIVSRCSRACCGPSSLGRHVHSKPQQCLSRDFAALSTLFLLLLRPHRRPRPYTFCPVGSSPSLTYMPPLRAAGPLFTPAIPFTRLWPCMLSQLANPVRFL